MSGAAPSATGFERLVQQSIIYAGARLLVSGLDLFLLPVYARVLSPEDYGLVAIAATVLAVLAIVCPLGLDSALARFFFEHEQETDAHRRVVTTLLVGATVSALAVSALVSALGPGLFGGLLTGMPPAFFRTVVWAAFLNMFLQLWLSLLQIRRQAVRYLMVSFAQAAFRGPLTVILIVGLDRGADGWAQAYLATGIVGAIVAIVSLRTITAVRLIDARLLSNAFRYGLPVLIHQLAGWTSVHITRLILNQLSSLSVVAIYQVAYGIGQGVGLITTAVNFAYAPFFMAEATKSPEEAARKFGAFATYYLAGILGLSVATSLFAEEITIVAASNDFAAAAPLVPLALSGFVLQAFYYMLVNPIYFRKAVTPYLPLVTVAGGIASVVASYALIPHLGARGAVWVAVLSNLTIVGAAYPLARKALQLRFEYGRIGVTIAVAVLVVGVSRWLRAVPLSDGSAVLANLGLLGIYVTTLAGLGIVTKSSARRVVDLFSRERWRVRAEEP